MVKEVRSGGWNPPDSIFGSRAYAIRDTLPLAIELERNVLTGIAARCKVHEGTDRVVLEDRALKATRDDREVKWIVEDIGHVRLVADMLSSLLVELRFDLA